MIEPRLVRIGLRIATVAVLAFVYAPLLILAIYAFNPTIAQVWPPPGLTLRWWAEAATNGHVVQAFLTSMVAAAGATAIALVLGTSASLAVQRFAWFGRDTISFLFVLPIALPGVVTGIALAATFETLDLRFGLATVIVGHATFCVVIAYNNVLARLRRIGRTAEEASVDLGADTWQTFRRVTLPALRTALLAGALLAFALSFDEVIVTIFTAGPGTETLPLWIFASMRLPNELPIVNVVAIVLIALSVIPVYLAQRIAGETAGVSR